MGRFLGAVELLVRSGDPIMASLYYLGVGTTESVMAFHRINSSPVTHNKAA